MHRLAPTRLASLASLALGAILIGCGGDGARLAGPRPGDPSLAIASTLSWANGCGIALVTPAGERRVLPQCGTQVAWSPDGQRIAFDVWGGEAAPPTLWIMNADGSDAHPVPNGVSLAAAAWSPDGSWIAANAAGTVVVIRPDGTGRKDFPQAYHAGFERPDWSPAGGTLLFVHADSLLTLYVLNGARRLVAVPGWQGVGDPRWSPDGGRIAFTVHGPQTGAPTLTQVRVIVIDADGSHQHIVADNAAGGPAAWSPDGTQIVYAGPSGSATTDLFVVPADGSAPPRQLTHDASGEYIGGPDWMR